LVKKRGGKVRCLGTPDWSALLDEALAHVMRLEKTPPKQGLCDCCKLRFLAAAESESC